jgi:hypothetical protein
MNTSNCLEQPSIQDDFATRKEVKEEDLESGNLSTDSVNSEPGPNYQI